MNYIGTAWYIQRSTPPERIREIEEEGVDSLIEKRA
jgi:hypothetical protein